MNSAPNKSGLAHALSASKSTKKWQRLYFMLAGFNLIVVLASLFITHQVATTYRHSLKNQQQWASEIAAVAELKIIAFEVVELSSNAFEIADADTEALQEHERMLNDAINTFDRHHAHVDRLMQARLKAAAQLPPDAREGLEQAHTDLEVAGEIMAAVKHDVFAMLDLLYAGDYRKATSYLGSIDRRYGSVLRLIHNMRNLLRSAQTDVFVADLQEADQWGNVENAMYVFVLLMVINAIYYGRQLGRKLSASAREREQYLQAIEASERKYRLQAAILDTANDAIVVTDINGIITFWNKGAEKFYGWTEKEVLGKPVTAEFYCDWTAYVATREELISKEDIHNEQIRWSRDGKELVIDRSWILVRDEQGKPHSVFTIDTDITARKEAEKKIYHLAFYDQLTGIPNRQLLQDRLQQAIMLSRRSMQKNALMFIDLDNFKNLNDTHGHAMGDLLLKEVANRLKACVRECDTVARFGGDEFVVVVNELSRNEEDAAGRVRVVGDKILQVLGHPYQVGELTHHSTPSIGVVLFDGVTGSIEDLIKWADLAMYKAKAAGRNGVHFYDSAMQTAIKN